MAHHLDQRAADIAHDVAVAGEDDELLSTTALAELTATNTSFWEILRSKGHGPLFVRLTPRRVRYRRSDVCEWLRERTYEATACYSDDWDKPQGRPRGVASSHQLSSNTKKRPASADRRPLSDLSGP
jgi:predicted DNA-binding transcriptional regulator AlpA